MNEMMEHEMELISGKGLGPPADKHGFTDWHQYVCSCGYKSPRVENYNNDGRGMLRGFRENHLGESHGTNKIW